MTSAAIVWNESYRSLAMQLIEDAKDSIVLRTFILETRFRRDKARVIDLVKALVRAKKRNVSVRVLLSAPKTLGVRVANVASAGLLHAMDLDVRVESGSEHGKYLLVDEEIGIIGSHNWTSAAFGSNVECSVALNDQTRLKSLANEFDIHWSRCDPKFVERAFPEMSTALNNSHVQLMLKDVSFETKTATNLPQFVEVSSFQLVFDDSYSTELLTQIDSATRSITVMMFRFSALLGRKDITDKILSALARAKSRGVLIQVLLDYDDANDRLLSDVVNQRALYALKEMGVEVRRDSVQRLLHAKFVVIDDEVVLVGSHNWTRNSLLLDGDVSAIINSPALSKLMHAEFSGEWTKAQPI